MHNDNSANIKLLHGGDREMHNDNSANIKLLHGGDIEMHNDNSRARKIHSSARIYECLRLQGKWYFG